jgi:hypothetical protein
MLNYMSVKVQLQLHQDKYQQVMDQAVLHGNTLNFQGNQQHPVEHLLYLMEQEE